MASHPLLDFIRRLRRARSVAEGGHLSDTQLLQRFAEERDEASFEVLVWRHGAMVLNVAQRLLRHSVDAEDVFQATFLTLARKASAIRRGTSVGSWLYKVAYRLALRARQTAARRQRFEQPAIENATAPIKSDNAEASAVLAEEVDRLPERYRAVVVLCYLQGATTEEASRLLGCPRGTVLSRLASARQRLRQRLVRRGIAPAVALAAVSFGETASATPAVALVACVIRAALPFAAGGVADPIVSPQAAALAEGALQMMMWNKIKIMAAMVCVIALVGTGSGWLARGRHAAETSLPAAEPPSKKEEPPPLPVAAADMVDKLKKEIVKVRELLRELGKVEDRTEEDFEMAEIDARLEMSDIQDAMRLQEQKWEFERHREQLRREAAKKTIVDLEYDKRALSEKNEAHKEFLKELTDKLEAQKKIVDETGEKRWAREEKHNQEMRPLRRRMFEAEYLLRFIEQRHAREREKLAAERQALLARLEQMERLSGGLEPVDRLRDLERKLDALGREVGELRRTLERQGRDAQKKPE